MICPSGRSYTKGVYEVKNIAEEDLSFVMNRQTTVLEWEKSHPKRVVNEDPVILGE